MKELDPKTSQHFFLPSNSTAWFYCPTQTCSVSKLYVALCIEWKETICVLSKQVYVRRPPSLPEGTE